MEDGIEGMLGGILGGMAGSKFEEAKREREKAWSPSGTADEMIGRLDDAEIEANRPCLFKQGDIVTPKKDANVEGRGLPFRVVKSYDKPVCVFSNPRKGIPGKFIDIEVGVCLTPTGMDEDLKFKVFQNSSKDFELWNPEKVEAK